MPDSQKVKVAIIGAGISGLAVANGLLRHDDHRFDVHVYERDSIAFDSERGGYQIRISGNGLSTLKKVSTAQTWSTIQEMWGGDDAKAPAMVNPQDFSVCINLADVKIYPQSRPIPRSGLRRALLQRPMQENRVHFGYKFSHFVRQEGDDSGVILHFENHSQVHADILIACDGSNSVVNRQVGLNNKVKLKHWTLFQARGIVDSTTLANLPKSLLNMGSCIFLGGRHLSGFSSVYRHEGQSSGTDEATLFWSIIIPDSVGVPIIEKTQGDTNMMIKMLGDYLKTDMKLGNTLPGIIQAATSNLRTGALTSSTRPGHDWRQGIAADSRIILLGDAIHPMTPGRGMGANQALVDAGNLVDLLRQNYSTSITSSDQSLKKLVESFDREMYDRAFKMVKASEDMTDLDLMRLDVRILVRIAKYALKVLGWGTSALEYVGMKRAKTFDYEHQDC